MPLNVGNRKRNITAKDADGATRIPNRLAKGPVTKDVSAVANYSLGPAILPFDPPAQNAS